MKAAPNSRVFLSRSSTATSPCLSPPSSQLQRPVRNMSERNCTKRKRVDHGDTDALDSPSSTKNSMPFTTAQKQYRVHSSLLAHKSTVFSDMFSLPQPAELGAGESLVDGCPLVFLQDSKEDVRNLLDLLYDPLKVHTLEGRISFSVVATMLRMGRKYDFKTLWDRGTALLQRDYPATLSKWDSKPKPLIARRSGLTFDVAALAHELDLKYILPSVYLSMFTEYNMDAIREGFATRSDFLTSDDLISCLTAREKLHKAVTQNILDWLHDDDFLNKHDFDSLMLCMEVLGRQARAVLTDDISENLEYLTTKWSKSKLGSGLCPKCSSDARREYENGRSMMWNELPSYFGLEEDEDEDGDEDEDEEQ
ncbi:unnamed protein product [Cyclocybe aegerita]|uniref:BTB domain-containing protein n=1 Tax=Cyclocybe aegerita TaxID=1973307 RepID=A0A8S0XUD2_CYCAE|nr:unnamed protein product [Cyclocybe aegerita]